jgi:hypothetical protein
VDTSSLDESTLRCRNEVVHVRSKTDGHHLGNDFSHTMDQTNRAEIRNGIRPILLGQKSNVCGVEPMEIFRMKIGEKVDHPHDIMLDNLPTRLVESSGEAIGAGSLVTRHRLDGLKHFQFRETFAETLKIGGRQSHARPIEITKTRGPFSHDRRKMVLDQVFLPNMVDDPALIICNSLNKILSSTDIDFSVEELSIGISILEELYASTLPLPSPVKHGQANYPSFEAFAQLIHLMMRTWLQ